MSSASNVRFIRVHGRIVPVHSDNGAKPASAKRGMALGMKIGLAAGAAALVGAAAYFKLRGTTIPTSALKGGPNFAAIRKQATTSTISTPSTALVSQKFSKMDKQWSEVSSKFGIPYSNPNGIKKRSFAQMDSDWAQIRNKFGF